jgi:ATP-dependent 26S proteasome regulatory subunit
VHTAGSAPAEGLKRSLQQASAILSRRRSRVAGGVCTLLRQTARLQIVTLAFGMQALRSRPSVIFLDDVHDLVPADSAFCDWVMLDAVLRFVHSVQQMRGVTLIAAAPNSAVVHQALQGLFDLTLRMRPPDVRQRVQLLQSAARSLRLATPTPKTLWPLCLGMHGFLAADIAAVCEEVPCHFPLGM